jgi:hypothetical protein
MANYTLPGNPVVTVVTTCPRSTPETEMKMTFLCASSPVKYFDGIGGSELRNNDESHNDVVHVLPDSNGTTSAMAFFKRPKKSGAGKIGDYPPIPLPHGEATPE